MSQNDIVAQYRSADKMLSEYEKEYGPIITAYKELQKLCKAAQDALKAHARDTLPGGTERVVDNVSVKCVKQYTVDPSALQSVVNADKVQGLFRKEVDTDVLKAAIASGLLNKEAVDACRTVLKATTIYIKVLDGKEEAQEL